MKLVNDEPSGLWYWLRHHMRLTVCMLSPSSYLLGGISVVSPLYNLVFIPWFSILVIPVLFIALFLSAIDYQYAAFVWELMRYLLMPLIWSIQFSENMWWLMSEAMTKGLLLLTFLVLLKPVLSARSIYFSFLMTIGYLIDSQHVTGWRVDVLDVGHGLAILIEKNHHDVLYDTGKQWPGGSIAQSVIDPVLHLRGIDQLDGLILSHMDNDHAGGRGWIAEHWHPLWMRSSQSLQDYLPCVQGEKMVLARFTVCCALAASVSQTCEKYALVCRESIRSAVWLFVTPDGGYDTIK
ncbi:ComEC/Rec2 family competence protein [Vibrio sp. PP-XX7]